MKKIFLPALSLLLSAASFAQVAPTLTAANWNPVINDSFSAVICDTMSVLPGASGANITWNFTGLTPSTTIIPDTGMGYAIYAHAASGYSTLALIPGTMISSATHAVITPSTVIPGVTQIETYYIEGVSSTSNVGNFANTSNGAAYSDPIDVMRFPFTFLSTFNDTYAGLVTFNATSATEAGSVTTTADAWGTLNLPGGASYSNTLRVHSYQLFHDSASIFGSPTVIPDTIETYTWYQPGYHTALLTIATTRTPFLTYKAVSYAKRQLANHEGVPYLNSLESSLAAYPSPAEGNINIAFNIPSAQQLRISLYDMAGREVSVIADKTFQGTQTVSFSTGSLAKGTYLLNLRSADGTVSRKIEIR